MKAKIHYLKDIPECNIRKGDVEEVDIPASFRFNEKDQDPTVWCPDCMDEVSEYIEPIMLRHLKDKGFTGNKAIMFYGGEDDDKREYKKITDKDIEYINKYKLDKCPLSSVCQLRGSKYDEETLTVDHSWCELVNDNDTFFIENIIDIIEFLSYYKDFYVSELRIRDILDKMEFDKTDKFISSFTSYVTENIEDMKNYGDLEISTIFQILYHINCEIGYRDNITHMSEYFYINYGNIFKKALKEHAIGFERFCALFKCDLLLMNSNVFPTYKELCDEYIQKYKKS